VKPLRTLLYLTTLFMGLLALPLTLEADGITVYSDFGPGQSYYPNVGYFVTAGETMGIGFTNSTGQNVDLTQIDVAIGVSSGNNSVTLGLYTDNGGVPGTFLESWIVDNLPAWPASPCCPVDTVFDSAGVVLQNGATYFLTATAGSGGGNVDWSINNIGASGPALGSNGTSWNVFTTTTANAFDVLGTTAVPEPPTLLLMGVGLGLLIGLKRLL